MQMNEKNMTDEIKLSLSKKAGIISLSFLGTRVFSRGKERKFLPCETPRDELLQEVAGSMCPAHHITLSHPNEMKLLSMHSHLDIINSVK